VTVTRYDNGRSIAGAQQELVVVGIAGDGRLYLGVREHRAIGEQI
jgi:hypothetical protein